MFFMLVCFVCSLPGLSLLWCGCLAHEWTSSSFDKGGHAHITVARVIYRLTRLIIRVLVVRLHCLHACSLVVFLILFYVS